MLGWRCVWRECMASETWTDSLDQCGSRVARALMWKHEQEGLEENSGCQTREHWDSGVTSQVSSVANTWAGTACALGLGWHVYICVCRLDRIEYHHKDFTSLHQCVCLYTTPLFQKNNNSVDLMIVDDPRCPTRCLEKRSRGSAHKPVILGLSFGTGSKPDLELSLRECAKCFLFLIIYRVLYQDWPRVQNVNLIS